MTLSTLTKNTDIKILSVVLALTLWLSVAGKREGEVALTVPLEVRDLSPGLMISNFEEKTVEVTLSGPKILLLKLRSEKIIMPLEMKGLREGRVLFTGFERKLKLPHEVRVTRVYPASVELVLVRGTVTNNPTNQQK